jgi:hypothetical protein
MRGLGRIMNSLAWAERCSSRIRISVIGQAFLEFVSVT